MNQVDELKTVDGDGRKNGMETGEARLSFEPEQQARVQELIDDAYRRAYAKAQKAKGPSEEVERLKGEVEKLRDERKSAAILRAVTRHNVVDAEEVTELIRSRVRVDEDGNIAVTGDSGATRITSAGLAMSLDEYVAEWLSDRPHHLRSAGPLGAGSRVARFGRSGATRYNLADPSVWRAMPREELDRLLGEGISVQGAAGQVYSFKDVKNPFVEARKRKFRASANANG